MDVCGPAGGTSSVGLLRVPGIVGGCPILPALQGRVGLVVPVLLYRSALPEIDRQQFRPFPRVGCSTAPGPITGTRHQPALYRIRMHILQLFTPLLRAPYVEIDIPNNKLFFFIPALLTNLVPARFPEAAFADANCK